MKTEALRKAFTEVLLSLAREDASVFAVATDSRGSVTLGDFAAELPDQFVECGIAEQDAVGIAAGLAGAGLRPFVCGPASFYAMRSAEQIKVDVAYSQMNVKILAVSGGISYGALGGTHHSVQDIALMRAIAGLEVYIPSDGIQMRALTRYLATSEAPAYARVGRGAVPQVYTGGETAFTPGKANRLRKGEDVAIIACGEMVHPAMMAANLLMERGISASVYDMVCIKPLDTEAIIEASGTGLVVTVEEHSVHGGLGGAVAEILTQRSPTRQLLLGLPDEPLYSGTSAEVFAHYALTAEGIARRVENTMSR